MNPTIAGFFRGVVLAVLTAVIDQLVASATGQSFAQAFPMLAPWQPVIVLVLRTLEGVVDHMRAPQQSPSASAAH